MDRREWRRETKRRKRRRKIERWKRRRIIERKRPESHSGQGRIDIKRTEFRQKKKKNITILGVGWGSIIRGQSDIHKGDGI